MPEAVLQHRFLNPTGSSNDRFDFTDNEIAANKNEFKRFMKNVTAKEFINLISGRYGHNISLFGSNMAEQFKDHRHNNPQNVDLAVRLLKRSGGKDGIRSILDHFHVSPKMIDNILENYHDYADDSYNRNYNYPLLMSKLSKQKNLTSEHITKVIKHPVLFNKELPDSIIANDNFNENHVHEILDSQVKLNNNHINDLLEKQNQFGILGHGDILDKNLEKLFNRSNLQSYNYHVGDRVLEAMSPQFRKEFIDKKLGITGGRHRDEDNTTPEDNWNNWEEGPDISSRYWNFLAQSKHLDAQQAEHIMRHIDDLDVRWNLFHNGHIGNTFADQMYQKWLDDNYDHGYDLDKFKNKIKEEHEFSYDDYIDAASEQARDEYPIEDFIRDNYSDADLVGKDRDDWIQDYLDDKYEWTYKDPQRKLMDDKGDPSEQEDEETDYSYDQEDHPFYDERYKEADDAYDNEVERITSRDIPDHIYDKYSESLSDREHELAERMYDDDMDNAHENEDFLPNHLTAIQEIKRQRTLLQEQKAFEEAKQKELYQADQIDPQLPIRFHEHEYGEGQHHIEMAKEYADANGGTINIDHLHKAHPNLVDTWKKIFNGKGKVTSQELQQKLEELPKKKFNLSYGFWSPNDMQNTNKQHEVVVRLDHSPESLAEIKQNPDNYHIFSAINETAQRSGHPSNFNTIAWARVDFTDQKNPFIDEMQSDFEKSARKIIENHAPDKLKNLDSITKIQKGWGEALLNAVIKLAKQNGAETLSTHSPESKAAVLSASKIHSDYKNSYEKFPRRFGFKPVDMDKLPLSEDGKEAFRKQKSAVGAEDLIDQHLDGVSTHGFLANAHTHLSAEPVMAEGGPSDLREIHSKMAEEHQQKFKEHLQRIKQLDPTHELANIRTFADYSKWHLKGLEGSEEEQNVYQMNKEDALKHATAQKQGSLVGIPVFGFDSALKQTVSSEGHKGHQLQLTQSSIKKSIIVANLLIKSQSSSEKIAIAQALMNIQAQQQEIEQLQQTNPEAHKMIHELVETLVTLFKEVNEEPVEAAIHEAEAQEQLQPPEQAPSQQEDQETPQFTPEGSVPPPRQADPLTHGKLVYPPGAIRNYQPGEVREKTPDGEWMSVAGGTKRADFQ